MPTEPTTVKARAKNRSSWIRQNSGRWQKTEVWRFRRITTTHDTRHVIQRRSRAKNDPIQHLSLADVDNGGGDRICVASDAHLLFFQSDQSDLESDLDRIGNI